MLASDGELSVAESVISVAFIERKHDMAASPKVIISAPKADVEQLLKNALSDAQRADIVISTEQSSRSPLQPERQGEYETLRVIVEFTATTIASGVVYDLIKLVVKAAVDRFGKDKVN